MVWGVSPARIVSLKGGRQRGVLIKAGVNQPAARRGILGAELTYHSGHSNAIDPEPRSSDFRKGNAGFLQRFHWYTGNSGLRYPERLISLAAGGGQRDDKESLAGLFAVSICRGAASRCKRPATEPGAAVQIGQAAPQFKLPDLKGREFALDQYRGKIVLLDFWATWCGPCRMTMPLLEKLQHEFPDDLTLLAINLQDPTMWSATMSGSRI